MAFAVEITDLYRGEAIVTGTEEPERTRGLRVALRDVFIKLAGDFRLEHDDRLGELLKRPHRLIESLEYEDRMKDIPVHDEQGTRERPHFLRVTFKQRAIDAELSRLGLKKWASDRPLIAVWLGVVTARGRYILSSDGKHGYGQRAVIIETAKRRGMSIELPRAKQDAVKFADVAERRSAILRTASSRAEALLVGMLTLKQAAQFIADCSGPKQPHS